MVKAKVNIKGHPIHPLLVTVPIGLLTGTVLADIAFVVFKIHYFVYIAFWTSVAGVVSGLVAAVPGLLDYYYVAQFTTARKIGLIHMCSNIFSLLLFGLGTAFMFVVGPLWSYQVTLSTTSIVLHMVAFTLLMLGGALGGEMSYRHRIGMVEERQNAAKQRTLTFK